jgi:SAM-dependent methyltransferase
MAWVARYATDAPVAVLDLGGRDVGGPWGGSPRKQFPQATVYTVVDMADGPDVDVIADASAWTPDRDYDVVVSMECFEHTAVWPAIVGTAFAALVPGGLFVATMAGPGRPPHGALGADVPGPGEWYRNVGLDDLRRVLTAAGFVDVVVDQQFAPCDVRCAAWKP